MTEKNNDVPMIELHKVEGAIVHASKWGRIAMILCICATIAIVCSFTGIVKVVDIFTTKYNARTTEWITAYMELSSRLGIAEVADERIQQLAPP